MANINQKKKYHFIYKTTDKVTGKYYVGMHSTSNLKDGYLGSGKRLRSSIRKYGKDRFSFEILEFVDSRLLLEEKEREVVTTNLLRDKMCLNLKEGGSGGVSKEVGIALSKAGLEARKNLLKSEDPRYLENLKRGFEQISKRNIERMLDEGENYPLVKYRSDWTGRKHTPESITKMKLAAVGRGIGKTNSQFGTCWITDGKENKKIKRDTNIPEGWRLGRR